MKLYRSSVACSYLTLSHGRDLVLDGQHQFGLSGQVLAAPLLVLKCYGDAARQVVHAADDRQVSVRLWRPMMRGLGFNGTILTREA